MRAFLQKFFQESGSFPFLKKNKTANPVSAVFCAHIHFWKPPFLCLVASGGHSHIVEVQDYTHYHILGHTAANTGLPLTRISKSPNILISMVAILYPSLFWQ